jgi:predicted amidophosphoribosyltransferase
MSNTHQIKDFVVQHQPHQMFISIAGARNYYNIIRNAFKNYHFSAVFDDRLRPGYWGTFIHNIDEATREEVVCLLDIFKRTVLIEDALTQNFALDHHWKPGYNNGRTEIGELFYKSKYSSNPQPTALTLSKHFEDFVSSHPSYLNTDYIISVPPNPNKLKSFDLPGYLVEQLCNNLNLTSGQSYVHRIKETKMKDRTTRLEKTEEIRGAFQVASANSFPGKTVTIIDDIYQTGITLHELAITLQSVGANVQALVATKTLKKI